MLGSSRSAITSCVRLTTHDWLALLVVRNRSVCVKAKLSPQQCTSRQQLASVHLARPLSSVKVSATDLVTNPDKVPEALLVPKTFEMIEEWSDTCKGKPVDEIETSLDSLLESLGPVLHTKKYTEGRLYVQILSQVEKTIDTENSKNIMRDFLQRQRYSSLGFIHQHAVKDDIVWLKDAVEEWMQLSIPTISIGADLVTAYYYVKLGYIPKDAGLKLEMRTSALLEKLSYKNIVKILHILALIKYRSVNLVGSLLFNLQKKPAVLNETELNNLFFTAAALNIASPRMLSCLETFSNTLLDNTMSLTTENIVNMVASMGIIKWNNESLLIKLCNRLKDTKELSVGQFAKVLSTCSTICALPDIIKEAVVEQLKTASKDPESIQHYLDIAWCLLIFDIKSEHICKDLLSEPRISSLTQGLPEHTVKANYSKLLNIWTTATVEFDLELPQKLMSCSKMVTTMNLSEFHNQLGAMLLDCLGCNITHLERGAWYPTGNNVDFRYLYDIETNKVIAPSEYKAPYDPEPGNKKDLSPHMQWVAIFGNMYQHTTIGTGEWNPLHGRRRLAEQQLTQLGYHVITVNESEFVTIPDRAKKLEWLKKKLILSYEEE